MLYGSFDWLWHNVNSSRVVTTLIAVYDIKKESWSGLTPSVWGDGVYAATWKDVGESFFVVGQLRGLSSSPGFQLQGVAECRVNSGCSAVGEGLPSVPKEVSSVVWNPDIYELLIVWKATGRSLFSAQWGPAMGWTVRDLPIGIALASHPRLSLWDRESMFLVSNSASSLGLWSCDNTSPLGQVFFTTAGGLNGCWSALSLPWSPVGPIIVAGPNVLIYGMYQGNASVAAFGNDMFQDLTFNLPVLILPNTIYDRASFLIMGSQARVYFLRQNVDVPCAANCLLEIFYLDAAVEPQDWRRLDIRVCFSGQSALEAVVASALHREILSWACSSGESLDHGVSFVEYNVTSKTQRKVGEAGKMARAAKVSSICDAGQSVFIHGAFTEIMNTEGDFRWVTPAGAALWHLGSFGKLTVEPVPLSTHLGNSNLQNTACRTNVATSSLWVSQQLAGDEILIALYRFANAVDDQTAGTWKIYRPTLPPAFLPNYQVGSIPFQIAPVEYDGTILLPFPICVPANDTCGGALLSLKLPSGPFININATLEWQIVHFFSMGASSDTAPVYAGFDLVGSEVWLSGEFVYSFSSNNASVSLNNFARFDLNTLDFVGSESAGHGNVVTCSAVGGDSYWIGGSMSSLSSVGEVINLAGMLLKEDTWSQSTLSFNAPPAFAVVQGITFNIDKTLLVVLSADSDPSYARFNNGMNVFSATSVQPNPIRSLWYENVQNVAVMDMVTVFSFGAAAGIVVLTLLLIVGASALIALLWKRGARNRYRYIQIPDYASHGVETNVDAILRDGDVLKLDPEKLQLESLIGQGGQGAVRRAIYDGELVAAKVVIDFSPDVFSSFLKEIKLLASITHPNIVQFRGILLKDQRLYLITELMDTDLTQLLSQLDDQMRAQVSMDVASALAFLHSFVPPVLHRDCKPSNVLVSRDGRVKLADFGVSRLGASSDTQMGQMTRDAGTLLYMAPEVFASNQGYGTSADCYSFGLLLIELWTGENPFAPHEFSWILDFMEKIRTQEVLPGVDRLGDDCPAVIRELAASATSWIPEARPSMAFIVKRLKSSFAGISASLPVAGRRSSLVPSGSTSQIASSSIELPSKDKSDV